MAQKYIIVSGGVLSGIGKGVVSSSIARIMKEAGRKVSSLKIDPYLNVDAGTMNPNQHGEVFVTDDGYEADLDLGHYERFSGINMKRCNNITAGQIYKHVIEKEREGMFLGGTVQMVPHVTNEVKNHIKSIDTDLLIIEIGGTVGDIEAEIFLEAVRELSVETGREDFMFIHVTYVPFLKVTNEFKTKPTQQSIQTLRKIGIQPDMIVVRTESEIDRQSMEKVSLFGGVAKEYVINLPDLGNIYEVPEKLHNLNIHKLISQKLRIDVSDEFSWNPPRVFDDLKIALIGKYLGTDDAYKSILESIFLCGARKPELIDAELLEDKSEDEVKRMLEQFKGIIIPGGFGKRGTEGKINAIKYARKNKVPILGICLGLQTMVIEYARNVAGLEGANSTEFDPDTKYPVIDIMEEQKKILKLGGTMRLGSQETRLFKNTKVYDIYGEERIFERHRHRFEVNMERFAEIFTTADKNEPGKLMVSGISDFVEVVELKDHPFFIGVQYHPELKSKVGNPGPLFAALVDTIRKMEKK
ncbi:MAG TPA: CTP synthase [Petrotogaceae bacterium]|jgi:CTP synthase|nr:CTP synthase [Petrotogaceae bacterium]HNV05728.1 CTP synthase [Petrotogaceae bacterium]HNY37656.1 CTP synthase [Petrotogaceae bacterium]HOG35261.1 CTP synthase [Petrotogaceae bacterium]HPX16623.1 CTP synthase [Petrotogaceae bacterium]